ncbi:MAG: response regulator [Thainema sp.]
MTTLRFLLLEDNPLDADVVRLTLTEGGINCDLQIVDTRAKFEATLNAEPFDLILADYALPGFDGLTALEMVQNQCPDIPFIFVSASLGEELAIESLKMGATDYVLKQRLGRLVPCVERALQEAQEQRDRKAAEAALQESEARFKGFAENHKDVIWITDVETRQIVYVSPSYDQVWGRHATQICTNLDCFLGFVHPDDRDRVQSAWRQCAEDTSSQEYRVIRPDDTVIWIRDRCFPIYDDQGDLLWIGGIAEDISDRKQAEATITADLHDTRLLQELGARLTSEENIQVLYNETMAAAISLSRADAGSFQCFEFDANELKLLAAHGLSQTIVNHFDRVMASSQTSCGQALIHGERAFVDFDAPDDPDGSLKMHLDAGFLSAQSTPLISRSGKFIGMFSTHWRRRHRPCDRELRFLDLLARQAADLIEQRQSIAERQRLLERERAAREEAEQVNRIKDEFLAVLSHELRSPLNPILAWSKLLQIKKLDDAKVKQGLNTIERNVKLQTQLIDDLLDVAKILRGKLKLNIAPVNLASVIRSAMEVVRTAAEAKSISLQFEPIDICQVQGDGARLQQIVWNLLSNAVKFTPNGGRVEVELEQVSGEEGENIGELPSLHQPSNPPTHPPIHPSTHSPSYAQITVTDTGRGINPDFLPYIFQSFRQADSSTTRQYGGLGLGLSIVKNLVDAHGGRIMANSLGEGQSATFTVQLPLLKAGAAHSPSESQAPVDLDLMGIKVLAVDDLEDARDLLTIMLNQYGAEVEVVASGHEVLAHLETFQPDVLVCDIGLPEMDGCDLIQQIRALPFEQGRDVPAIAVTAYAREEDHQRTLQRGFQRHITKPIEPEQLIAAIAELALPTSQ